jgi:hypothetical protein
MFGGRRSAIENWKTFHDGRLRKTLSEMIDQEEFTFYTAGLENCYEGKTPPIDRTLCLRNVYSLWKDGLSFAISKVCTIALYSQPG